MGDEDRRERRPHARAPRAWPANMAEMAAESVLIGAGGRAILLQLADPAVGRGVAAHSDFQADPMKRLRNTLTYVYAVASGTPDDVELVRALVDRAHGPVRAPATAGDPGYDAADAGLQLWVAATLYDSAVNLFELVYGPLDDATADRIYAEHATLGTALQMPAELWPADRDAFRAYWDARIEALAPVPGARVAVARVLHPTVGPLWLRVSMPIGRLLTAGLLPASVRAAFDLPWDAARERRFRRVLRIVCAVYPRLPARLRHWPRDHFLRRLRRLRPS